MLKSEADIESDDFNNLLILESKVKELKEKKLLTVREIKLLDMLSESASLSDISSALNSNRNTITKEIKKVCELIAYFLGDIFTDDGYLNYMQEKYKLTDTQLKSLRDYMNGKNSKKLLRRPTNG
jgi:DNA-binding CsgD family transcriptional regulator